ncbi:hypothetical protein HEP_00527700, partial [Hepatocystis sp. ex Piliocolobus tephrosceles]
VSVGIFDVCNKNINESKLKEMNITISDVADQESNKQYEKDLIKEI